MYFCLGGVNVLIGKRVALLCNVCRFQSERPVKCSKEIWNKAMVDIEKGKLKNC
uniref:Uncharacterized protein n=1 Tax=Meloidogyne enterolobii TaxID=390850 RepID=A0A6V7YDJ5_MELEN|nr:unnamed protein product [Meloidogyne enterolobii]